MLYSSHRPALKPAKIGGSSVNEFPGWTLDGRTFKTVSGLCNYLLRKHAGNETSMVRPDRSLSVYETTGLEIARYYVAAPKIGKTMALTISHERVRA
jgi:hypothetical protein